MSEHTKEPWKLQDDGSFVSVVAGRKACVLPAMRSNDCLHDFRRIVACVNACDGIPTDMLEAMPSGPAALLPMYARLEQQRDELLAALKRCRFDSLNMTLADLEFCRASIAKAEAPK